MKRFKTNLLVGLSAAVIGVAITGLKYLAADYNTASAVVAFIIIVVLSTGFAYLMDGLAYVSKKIGGRK